MAEAGGVFTAMTTEARHESCAPAAIQMSAVISDVDGTLVTDDKVLTACARAAVAELRASGIIFSIISSRPPRGLRTLIERLGIETPVGGFNGGVIATTDLAMVTEHLLPSQVARRARGRAIAPLKASRGISSRYGREAPWR